MSRTRERYARMMATFWRNPRVRALSDSAIACYCMALSYACDQLNDGTLSADEALAMCARGKKAAIRELVAAGFWDEAGAGYTITNYLEHNLSREDIEAKRREASEHGKRGGRPKADANQNGKGTLSPTIRGTLTQTETHVERTKKEPLPLRGDAAEDSPPLSLPDRVARQLDLTPTPGSVVKLLELLSALHCRPDGAPYAEPGMPSSNDRKMLVGVIQRGDMRTIAAEWVAMLALVASGDKPDIRNPLAYFAKCFGGLEAARLEANAPFPPATHEAA